MIGIQRLLNLLELTLLVLRERHCASQGLGLRQPPRDPSLYAQTTSDGASMLWRGYTAKLGA